MKTYVTSDFKLTFADENLNWASAPRPGLPILRWPDRTICEPAMYYFGYSAENKRVKISSMKPEAYALREWLTFLANNGLCLFDVSDDILERWRTSQGWVVIEKNGRRKIHPAQRATNHRISKKIHCVFEFYRVIHRAMPFGADGDKTPNFVSPSGNTPLSSKTAWNGRLKREYPVWSRAEGFKPSPKAPRSPQESEVLRLYSFLRGKAFRTQQKLKLSSPPEHEKQVADRNWLIARTMALGGLRCDEVGNVNVDQIAHALLENGITRELIDLDSIADVRPLQQSIVGKVLSLKKGTEYAFMRVLVKGKGDKERWAPFDPQLVCDILENGIWGIRASYLKQHEASRAGLEPSRHLFLSEKKSGERLTAKAIGDIIGAGFRCLGIKSSAHKLRAYYATNTAASLWREYFSNNRYNFDASLVNNVLQNLASALGHNNVTTSIKYYVNAPLFKHLTKVGTPEAELFRKLYDILILKTNSLSVMRQGLLLETAELLVKHQDNSMVVKALQLLLNHPDISPKQKSSGPTLVADSTD